ncbi:MAG: siderophore staphylobactin biosynthesis protein SbnC [Actinophytocola sp.]|nr:siderophore staphylobactin biosynthesis protein SbnC [Actinophytocola sp.]
MTEAEPAELVLRDLIDALLQENLYGVADALLVDTPAPRPEGGLAAGERWCRIPLPDGWLAFRGRDGGGLQAYRLSRAPVWHGSAHVEPQTVGPDEVLTLLTRLQHESGATQAIAADLRAAVVHTGTTLADWAGLPDRSPRPGSMLAAERMAATRNRPFHPTARAVGGWSATELSRYGPMRRGALGMPWIAVRRERLRHGSGEDSHRLEHLVLDDVDLGLLAGAARHAGVSFDDYQPLPVHPWQAEHVLPELYASELARRDVVPLARDLGRCHATSSLRTLITCPEAERHLKLPLGVATLGAARLLPPRYLDNAERAERTMRQLIERDDGLRELVMLCDENTWCGWRDPVGGDEFDDRPGQLAAQIRRYPAGVLDAEALVLPMAALAAHEWPILETALAAAGFTDPVAFFRALAEAFCSLAFGFLRYGVLPELHGQNVLVMLANGRVTQFVLRDHDTLRLYPEWLRAAGVPDPGYRIKPGAPQSLHLSSAEELLGYAQTLGFQVNLYGIADAMVRHYGIDELTLWHELRESIAAGVGVLPAHVAELVSSQVLRAPEWPSRQVLGPLLRRGRSAGVSMPASAGRVPNPLLAAQRVRTVVG